MKRYVIGRLFRAIISILVVTCVAIVLIYSLVPRDVIFKNDQATIQKLSSKPDKITDYKFTRWAELGYLRYVRQSDICKGSDVDYDACMKLDSTTITTSTGRKVVKYSPSNETKKAIENFKSKGYEVLSFNDGYVYGYRDYKPHELIFNFLTNLIKVDGPNKVVDEDNKDLERKVYFGKDFNGVPAIMCSGCEHNYLLYFNGKFPFIHQNWIKLNFGVSFPTFSGQSTLDVINQEQGVLKKTKQKFSNGYETTTASNLHTCKYKPNQNLDHLDKQRFDDNYADCKNNYQDFSMVQTSYIFGISSVILAYAIALPAAMYMAQKKNKIQDKIGIIYINIMIALPSLAFIYFMKLLGNKVGLPDKFPLLGYGDIRSYILPIVILALLGTAGIMIWVRRYMVDQMNADYVKFAKAKGLSQGEIFRRHILKNAIIPITNGIPRTIILAIGGSVITETVFAISGMGKMLPDAIKVNNNNMIITLTFIFTSLSILSLLLGDIVMSWVDPRIQLTAKGVD